MRVEIQIQTRFVQGFRDANQTIHTHQTRCPPAASSRPRLWGRPVSNADTIAVTAMPPARRATALIVASQAVDKPDRARARFSPCCCARVQGSLHDALQGRLASCPEARAAATTLWLGVRKGTWIEQARQLRMGDCRPTAWRLQTAPVRRRHSAVHHPPPPGLHP
ncbi:Uncharacterised protein [Mycobacteroides abscessus subsp. abscessus]|nr:Uncharacterised protein [Mycobacteroides abscessus subsp. abscessus]